MVSPLASLLVEPSNFGGEIIISWEYPEVLPTNYKVFLFKRSNQDVTQAEIDGYFTDSNFVYNGLFVKDDIKSYYIKLADLTVLNDTVYYYKLVIRDEDTKEYSSAVSGHATPQPKFKVNIKDGKKIVATALEKMLDNIYSAQGKKVSLAKDVKIVKHFAIEPISDNYFMVERINGSTQFQFVGNILQMYQSSLVSGDMDLDVIRVTFMTAEPERRDTVANILRGMKPFLIKVCRKLGAKDCRITIEGDYYNPQVHGFNFTGFNIVLSLLIENKMIIEGQEMIHILGDLQIDKDE